MSYRVVFHAEAYWRRFDVREVWLDVAEVRAVGRQEENVVTILDRDGFKFFPFMDGGVVEDERPVWALFLAKAWHAVQPLTNSTSVVPGNSIGVSSTTSPGKCLAAIPCR